MRICQLSHVETAFNFIAPLFEALRDDGHDVVAASSMDHDGAVLRQYLGDGFDFHRVEVSRKISARAFTVEVARLARYLHREGFDVVHVHGPMAAIQGRLAARLARIPVVISHAHGFYFHDDMSSGARRVHIGAERVLGRYFTDYYITVNREDRRTAIRRGFTTDPERVVGTPSVGINTDRFRPLGETSRQAIRREFAVTKDALVVTFVGRLVTEKGVIELATAFADLARERNDARLFLVGDVSPTERDQRVRDRLDRMQQTDPALSKRIVMLGQRRDVPEVLAASDVFVLPSYREGMPVSLLEAMACEVPVITTDIRGCREAVADGEAGLIVPPRDAGALSDALRRLAADPDLRDAIGKAGRRHIEAVHTIDRALAPITDLYKRIARKRCWQCP
ncbi:MAG: glycosyltransferase family 4 protein [Pseudonocardia sp.]|nr:glycosyltransferase family 4 protein [Pseudonocardia sp.]